LNPVGGLAHRLIMDSFVECFVEYIVWFQPLVRNGLIILSFVCSRVLLSTLESSVFSDLISSIDSGLSDFRLVLPESSGWFNWRFIIFLFVDSCESLFSVVLFRSSQFWNVRDFGFIRFRLCFTFTSGENVQSAKVKEKRLLEGFPKNSFFLVWLSTSALTSRYGTSFEL